MQNMSYIYTNIHIIILFEWIMTIGRLKYYVALNLQAIISKFFFFFSLEDASLAFGLYEEPITRTRSGRFFIYKIVYIRVCNREKQRFLNTK